MKFSELAAVYERISATKNDPARVSLLASLTRSFQTRLYKQTHR